MGRSADSLARAASILGKVADPRPLDVTDEEAVAKLFVDLRQIDHVVPAAAGSYFGKITETDTAAAKLLFESKYWGQHHCIKHAGSRIRPGGSITIFSGWISRKPMIGTGTLAAIDAAIGALARIASPELAPVRVNAVVPGMIDTPLWGARLSPEQQKAHFQKVSTALPVGRAGTAQDVAHAVFFLMTNGFTSGAILDADGGQR